MNKIVGFIIGISCSAAGWACDTDEARKTHCFEFYSTLYERCDEITENDSTDSNEPLTRCHRLVSSAGMSEGCYRYHDIYLIHAGRFYSSDDFSN